MDFEIKDRADFQNMVDAQIEETLTLEYKAYPPYLGTARMYTNCVKMYRRWPTRLVDKLSIASKRTSAIISEPKLIMALPTTRSPGNGLGIAVGLSRSGVSFNKEVFALDEARTAQFVKERLVERPYKGAARGHGCGGIRRVNQRDPFHLRRLLRARNER